MRMMLLLLRYFVFIFCTKKTAFVTVLPSLSTIYLQYWDMNWGHIAVCCIVFGIFHPESWQINRQDCQFLFDFLFCLIQDIDFRYFHSIFFRFYELKFRFTTSHLRLYVETFLLLRHKVCVSSIKRFRFIVETFLPFAISPTVCFKKIASNTLIINR